jgi:hypothetical protein
MLMPLTHHIPHSLVAQTGYLHEALADLTFPQMMERFGNFFLHNLDLEHARLHRIMKKDGIDCLLAMSRTRMT